MLFNRAYIAHCFKMNLNAPIDKTFKTLTENVASTSPPQFPYLKREIQISQSYHSYRPNTMQILSQPPNIPRKTPNFCPSR